MALLTNVEKAALVGNRMTFVDVNAQYPMVLPAACWAWALRGTNRPINGADSAATLYANNNPRRFILDGPQQGEVEYRVEMDVSAIPTNDPAVAAAINPLKAAWDDAYLEGTDDARREFMRQMMAVAARVNGLTPSAVATPYRLYMTVPGNQWFHWQHWGIAVHHNGTLGFAQTEPNVRLYIGSNILAEAHLPGHLTAYIHLTALHDNHVNTIKAALMKPPLGAVWAADNTRNTCFVCHAAFRRGLFTSGKHHCRRCGNVVCNNCSQNNGRGILYRLRRRNGPAANYQAARMCDTCEGLNENRN